MKMPRLRSLFRAAEPARDVMSEHWWTSSLSFESATAVTADNVIQIPEVYDCLQVLSQTIAALPLPVFRRGANGDKQRVDGHPVAALLGSQANTAVETTAFELRAQMTWDLALHRNAFAEIRGDARYAVSELIRMDPGYAEVITGARLGEYVYELWDGYNKRRVSRDNVMHIRMTPLRTDGVLGRSLLRDGRRVFARALMLEDYARRFFENDATPGIIIRLPGQFKTREQAHEYRDKWKAQFSKANRHSPAILDGGAEVEQLAVENNKAQFIETYQAVATQIARLWRMPPHKIGILDRATFTNIEQQALEFVTDTLLPLLVAWEQVIRRDLLLQPSIFAEHNVGGLLRGDLKSRYEAYAIARNWGWLSANDVRRLENMNPLPSADGDAYLQPLNMVPAGQDAARAALLNNVAPAIAAQLGLLEAPRQ